MLQDWVYFFWQIFYQNCFTTGKSLFNHIQIPALKKEQLDEKKDIKNVFWHTFLWYFSTPWHIKTGHRDCKQTIHRPPHPPCPSCTTLSSEPSRFRIHLMPCCCGSMMSGQRSLVVRMAAFSVDILSFGRPWFCQAATVASSVSMRIGSRPSVRGTETWNRNREMMSL